MLRTAAAATDHLHGLVFEPPGDMRIEITISHIEGLKAIGYFAMPQINSACLEGLLRAPAPPLRVRHPRGGARKLGAARRFLVSLRDLPPLPLTVQDRNTLSTSTAAIRALVREGEIHSSVYCDPEIFQLEMDRLFHSRWLFLGHTRRPPAQPVCRPGCDAARSPPRAA